MEMRYKYIIYSLIGLLPACVSVQKTLPVPESRPELVSYQPIPKAEPLNSQPLSIVAVGDIMLGGKATPFLRQKGYDFPFAATKHLFTGADIVIGNLETALTEHPEPMMEKTYAFKNPPQPVASALVKAGFDIVSLANNHSMDYGPIGLRDTMRVLEENDLKYHGAGNNLAAARRAVVYTLPNAQTVGFLAYSNTFPEEFWAGADTPGTAFGHAHQIKEDVAKLIQQAVDVVVVSFHWGREREQALRPYQPELARVAIDAGADAVIGHHPHILQGIEIYKNSVILYSLGNYTFGTFSNGVQTSVVAELIFQKGAFAELSMTPININNFQVQLQPQILRGAAAERVYNELDALSKPLGVELSFDGQQIKYQHYAPTD